MILAANLPLPRRVGDRYISSRPCCSLGFISSPRRILFGEILDALEREEVKIRRDPVVAWVVLSFPYPHPYVDAVPLIVDEYGGVSTSCWVNDKHEIECDSKTPENLELGSRRWCRHSKGHASYTHMSVIRDKSSGSSSRAPRRTG